MSYPYGIFDTSTAVEDRLHFLCNVKNNNKKLLKAQSEIWIKLGRVLDENWPKRFGETLGVLEPGVSVNFPGSS